MWRAAVLVCAGLLEWAPGSGAQAATLCQTDETVAFSCETGRGIASLCQAGTARRPLLRYRFGRPTHTELSWPATDRRPARAFQSGELSFSGGGGAFVRFQNGRYRYTVFTATGHWSTGDAAASVAGVAVDRDGQNAASLVCRPETVQSSLGEPLFKGLRMKPGDAQGFEIPDAFLSR